MITNPNNQILVFVSLKFAEIKAIWHMHIYISMGDLQPSCVDASDMYALCAIYIAPKRSLNTKQA